MGIHTDTHTHTHTHPLRNIQAHRHKEGRHDHTLKHRYTKAQAHSYAGAVTLRATIRSKKANEHRQANTLKDNQIQRHNRRAEGHTQAQADHPQVHYPPPTPGLTLLSPEECERTILSQ